MGSITSVVMVLWVGADGVHLSWVMLDSVMCGLVLMIGSCDAWC